MWILFFLIFGIPIASWLGIIDLTDRQTTALRLFENHITMIIWTGIGCVVSGLQGCPLYWWNFGLVIWTFVMILLLMNEKKLI
jgi:hypothetical protein